MRGIDRALLQAMPSILLSVAFVLAVATACEGLPGNRGREGGALLVGGTHGSGAELPPVPPYQGDVYSNCWHAPACGGDGTQVGKVRTCWGYGVRCQYERANATVVGAALLRDERENVTHCMAAVECSFLLQRIKHIGKYAPFADQCVPFARADAAVFYNSPIDERLSHVDCMPQGRLKVHPILQTWIQRPPNARSLCEALVTELAQGSPENRCPPTPRKTYHVCCSGKDPVAGDGLGSGTAAPFDPFDDPIWPESDDLFHIW